MAVALCAALGATLAPGAAWVLEAAGFAQALEGVALCLTGEGQLDGQTPRGKAPWAVAQACRAAGVPVVAIGGDLGPGVEALSGPDGFAAVFSAQPGPSSLEDALDQAATRLEAVAEQVVRLFLAGGGAQ
ncbi:MAG: glycerate kinase [Planctomycetota bacterium]